MCLLVPDVAGYRMFRRCSPRWRQGVPLKVDGPLLLEEDINVAVEARSFGGEGRQVVTELLACLHSATWYVSSEQSLINLEISLTKPGH